MSCTGPRTIIVQASSAGVKTTANHIRGGYDIPYQLAEKLSFSERHFARLKAVFGFNSPLLVFSNFVEPCTHFNGEFVQFLGQNSDIKNWRGEKSGWVPVLNDNIPQFGYLHLRPVDLDLDFNPDDTITLIIELASSSWLHGRARVQA